LYHVAQHEVQELHTAVRDSMYVTRAVGNCRKWTHSFWLVVGRSRFDSRPGYELFWVVYQSRVCPKHIQTVTWRACGIKSRLLTYSSLKALCSLPLNNNNNVNNNNVHYYKIYRAKDRLCGLVVRVPGYTTEMYCASCEVRTEFIYVM
jgi:hypothetical protein